MDQFIKQNQPAIQFCLTKEDIPGCIDVLNMEISQLLNYEANISLEQSELVNTMNILYQVIQKAKEVKNQFNSQEDLIAKYRQNVQIKQQMIQDLKQSYEAEINKLMSTMMQYQHNEKTMLKQLNTNSIELQKMTANYDDVVRKYGLSEKTKKVLLQEKEQLQDRLTRALKNEGNTAQQYSKKPNIKILEDTIRDLYKDIYQVNIEKNANFDANLQILAEAVAHVQKTYNEDMNNATQQITLLNKRLVDAELKLKKM